MPCTGKDERGGVHFGAATNAAPANASSTRTAIGWGRTRRIARGVSEWLDPFNLPPNISVDERHVTVSGLLADGCAIRAQTIHNRATFVRACCGAARA